MSISPVSPINDPDLYIEHQNQRNKLGSSCEAMDETDFPIPPLPAGAPTTLNKVFCCANDNKTNTARGTFLGRPGSAVQIITTAAPLPNPPLVTSPDGTTNLAQQHITLEESGDCSAGKKVGESVACVGSPQRCGVSVDHTPANTKPSTNAKNSTNNDKTSTTSSTKRTTTNSTSSDTIATERSSTKRGALGLPKATAGSKLGATLSTSTAHTVGPSANASTGRISPSRSYDDMIKFVFTEHGIKVISDREYVV